MTVLFAGIHNFSKQCHVQRAAAGSCTAAKPILLGLRSARGGAPGVEKIKTNGDVYMAAAGLPLPRVDHADAIAEGLNMQRAAATIRCRPTRAPEPPNRNWHGPGRGRRHRTQVRL